MAPSVPVDFFGQKAPRKCSVNKSMGKSRKYSKGQAAGFIPGYCHAIGTMAESEGEMTVTEDSFAPNRKSTSLNTGGYDKYDVPMQVFSLSKMSKPERNSLDFRLKKELEQVRVLQRRVASYSSTAVLLSPSSDIRSCSDGQKRPSIEASAPNTKKRAPPDRSGSRGKKGRVHQPKAAVDSSMSTSMLMKLCETLLSRLMSQQFSWVFNTPVDVVKLNIPDYYTVIKQPMDLGTVKTKLASGQYSSPLEFAADVQLTFANAKKYNPPGNDVHNLAATLGKFFDVRWKAIEKKLQVNINAEPVHPSAGAYVEVETITDTLPLKQTKIMPSENSTKPEPVRQTMTSEEKQKLRDDLTDCISDLPLAMVEFLKQHCPPSDQSAEDEIELDIDSLSDKTLFELRKLLDAHLSEKQKKHGKSELYEMELVNESGFSNSSLQPCKGNEAVEEEVDVVGGNDPPISSFPAVEIEKDATQKQQKCTSSSSSSSDSDSSSDSASTSGVDVDAAEVIGPPHATLENAGENLDEKRSGDVVPDIGGQPETSMVQDNQNAQVDSTSDELPDNQEGEIAPPERRVSPEKAYRAAILIGRFADTILKAREKAQEKGENKDPETLRTEREELERNLREEKARLQAEAKAAEEARRKAEAEAAAEAKRKRGLEREAARQALLQMEKTVDINENSQFMEDLEMLRTAANEQGPNLEEDVNPDHLQKLQGSSNPLEQLGLYMKDDDEDEEEVELPNTIPEPAKGSSNPLEQLGLYMKDNEEDKEEVELPKTIPEPAKGSSNPLEQLGLYMKDDDEDEEEVELSNTIPEPAKGSSNPLEQLGLYMKDNEEDKEEVELPKTIPEPAMGISNPLEQLGLYIKDDEEEGELPKTIPEPAEGSSNPLEQLGLYMKDDDEDEEEAEAELPKTIPEPAKESSNPLEQLGVYMNDDNEDEEEVELPKTISEPVAEPAKGSSNPLEQLGLYMKDDDEDEKEAELSKTITEPAKDVEEGEND